MQRPRANDKLSSTCLSLLCVHLLLHNVLDAFNESVATATKISSVQLGLPVGVGSSRRKKLNEHANLAHYFIATAAPVREESNYDISDGRC